jgi:hypothetical protein
MVRPHLLYRISHNGGAVFAEKSVAHRIDAIHPALSEAKTWREFRRMLPKGEWKEIVGKISEWYDESRPDDESDVLRWDLDETPFNGFEDVPGVSEGYYPPWLEKAQDQILPADILENFATLKDTFLDGSFSHIDEDKADQVVAALRAKGYKVERADNLLFW